MEIWHHIAFSSCADPEGIIESLNIKHNKTPNLRDDGYLISFDIYESDPAWLQINTLADKVQAVDIWDTKFNKEEILAAEWLRFHPLFERGYPQPENGKWEENTYENSCPQCGAGFRQKAPFHIKKEPNMGKNDFLCLIWTLTVFCTPKVLEVLKANDIKGYEVWPTTIRRTKEPSQVISQLIFPHVTRSGLGDMDKNTDKIGTGICPVCGITKYAYHRRGYMHYRRGALLTDFDFQLTYEWFGSGAFAFREILVSNRVAKLILENGWQRVRLKPVELI